MTRVPFELLHEDRTPDDAKPLFAARASATSLGKHWDDKEAYQASPELVTAVNVALAVGAPLLLTGEPGTGKTQVAAWVAWKMGVERQHFYRLDVRSTTVTGDLTYHFDDVKYFREKRIVIESGKEVERTLERRECIRYGKLALALRSGAPSVLLIDEIDKAPRDFPNDLLAVIEEWRIEVEEAPDAPAITLREGAPPPFVVITSNSERRLPEPFLRRCIFHHIQFTKELLAKAVRAHGKRFPHLSQEFIDKAIEKGFELYERDFRKKVTTAEVLVWLAALNAWSAQAPLGHEILDRSLKELPLLSALVKDRDDYKRLE